MLKPVHLATVFVALCTHGTWTHAQIFYRCGDVVTQKACPGGIVVQSADERKPEQRTVARKPPAPKVFKAVVPRLPASSPTAGGKKKAKAKAKAA
jgi:hypothetical protein